MSQAPLAPCIQVVISCGKKVHSFESEMKWHTEQRVTRFVVSRMLSSYASPNKFMMLHEVGMLRCEPFLEADFSCVLSGCIANIYSPVNSSLPFSLRLGQLQRTGKDGGIVPGDEASSFY